MLSLAMAPRFNRGLTVVIFFFLFVDFVPFNAVYYGVVNEAEYVRLR